MQPDTFIPETCFALCAPDGPSAPFSTSALIIVDSFRILLMVMGMVLVVWAPRLALEARAPGQRARLIGQGIFALIVIGTEVDHLGDYAHYRLFITFIGISVMLWGVSQLRHESPPYKRVESRVRE